MPLTPELIVAGPTEGAVYSAVGDVYRVLASGEQTGGAYALLESRVLPGGGPPPHIHTREEESFFVLEGELTFWVGDRKVTGQPGTFVQIPRGTVHAFKNESVSPARMLIQTTPSGFELFLAEIAQRLASFDSPPVPVTEAAIATLLAAAPRYGITILPPPH